MYKKDLTLSNLQWLLCNKTQPKQSKSFFETEKLAWMFTFPEEEGFRPTNLKSYGARCHVLT